MDNHTIRSMAWDWITSGLERGLDRAEILMELQDTKRFRPISREFPELIDRAQAFLWGDSDPEDDWGLDYTTMGG